VIADYKAFGKYPVNLFAGENILRNKVEIKCCCWKKSW